MPVLAFFAAVLIATAPIDSTAARPIGQLVHSKWTTNDGAPADIKALAQTADGYLWLGTGAGLFRFDGVRFVHFTTPDNDSLSTRAVARLLATRDKSLWIVWANGIVSRLHDGHLTSFGAKESLASTFHLAESKDATVFAGTSTGLARFANDKWENLGVVWMDATKGTEARAIWFDRNDVLWVQTDGRVIYRRAGSEQFQDTKMIVRDRPYPADFAQQADGTVWMNELARSAHTLRMVGDSGFPSEVRVRATALMIDRRGSLWVGSTNDGLRRVLDPTRIHGKAIPKASPDAEQFTVKNGLLSDAVTALFEDREANVWVASTGGLERFREGAFTPVAPLDPSRSKFLFATRDTTLWVVAHEKAAIVRIGVHDSSTIPTDVFPGNFAQDKDGTIYTVRNSHVFKFNGKGFAPIPLSSKFVGINHTDITIDRNGVVWIYDEDMGLLRVSGARIAVAAELYEPVARRGVLFSDKRGRIWIGQLNQIAMYEHEKLTMFGAPEGVPSGLINQFIEDSAGNVWAAGAGGMSKFVNGRFKTVDARRASVIGPALGVAEDESGAWWIARRAGMLRLPPGEMDRALADSTYTIRYRAFDQLDGIPGSITPSFGGALLARTLDGRLWVATDSGVASVNPPSLPSDVASPVIIESARVDGIDVVPAEGARIRASRSDLEIDYTSTHLAMPERVLFRYQLVGADKTWRDAGARRRVTYSRLEPGSYRFRVAARNGDGAWDETGATWTFRVLPVWYQSLWFRALVVALIGAAAAVITAAIHRRRHALEQDALKDRYEATMAERSRIAQDLHDTLLQGFVGVTLQIKAAESALPAKPEAAAETLRVVQRLARESLREARERVWDMHQTAGMNLDLPAALESIAKERAAGTGIEITSVVSGDRRRLDLWLEDAALRMGREAVANAIKHAEADRIEIAVTFSAANIRVEIKDDGRGFSLEEAEEARRQGHFGLSGLRERALSLGGSVDVGRRAEGGSLVAFDLPLVSRGE